MKKEIDHGSFVISLDFELMWGMIDHDMDAYSANVHGVYKALPRLLELLEKYDIHATIAPVGLIYCKDKNDCKQFLPNEKPSYNNASLSPYENGFIENIPLERYEMFFAPDLIQLLKKYPNIEIGTHTFCHYYCWEEGQNIEQFESDLNAAKEISKKNGVQVSSIIFPRNNVSNGHLDVCRKLGIFAYRGNPPKFYNKTYSSCGAIKNRICRLLDNYINIGGSNIPKYSSMLDNGMVNVATSRFLRPYNSKLSFFDGLRLRRMKGEMLKAAKQHRLYHMWWHPHNMGINTDQNLAFLERILQYYKILNEKYNFQTFSMREFAEQFLNEI
jgi:peptidoglycan/xylan/chitin deacetylase (PgdA/CDA1 family)